MAAIADEKLSIGIKAANGKVLAKQEELMQKSKKPICMMNRVHTKKSKLPDTETREYRGTGAD